MKTKIKAAVIGVGSMGKNHARVYAELPDVDLVAVSDLNAAALTSVTRQTGARGYVDFQKMLQKEQPEVVSVAVPTVLHGEIAAAALEAGAHVLVEKPIACNLQEGRALIETARALNRQLMIGHIARFNPAIQSLKQRLEAGQLGQIYQVICRRVGPYPSRFQNMSVIIDLAPHDIDILRWLIGEDPIRIFAETEQHLYTDHEDLVIGLLRFPNGVTGCLEINWVTPNKVREVMVLGERGLFRVDDLTQDLYFHENSLAIGNQWSSLQTLKGAIEGQMIRYALERYEPLKAELKAFVQSIQENTPVPVSGHDGLEALRFSLDLVESGVTHQVIEITQEKNPKMR